MSAEPDGSVPGDTGETPEVSPDPAAENLDEDLQAEATEEGMPAPAGEDTDTASPFGQTEETSSEDADALSSAAADLAAERLADLQRLSAEFKNYRRATEERIELQQKRAKADAARVFLGVLDDLDLAEKHGDLAEGSAFATIAQKMRGVAEHLGVTTFGAKGDPFDHNVHDAVFQQPNPEVTIDTVAEVVSPGYMLEGELVRAAKVVVWTPEESK